MDASSSSGDPVRDAFSAAADDRRHGASEIEMALLEALLEARGRWSRAALEAGADALENAHPAMANLRSLGRRLRGASPDDLERWMRERLEELAELPERLADAAWPLVRGAARVVTVSRSSAVAAVMIGAVRQGWSGQVVVLDGTSSGGGAEQAARLCGEGVDARSQPDGRAPSWLEGSVVVVTGADAVGRERFVNAAGTRSLLRLAAAAGVRAWLVADRAKDLPEEVLDDLLDRVRTVRQDGPGREWPVLEGIPLALVAGRVDGRR